MVYLGLRMRTKIHPRNDKSKDSTKQNRITTDLREIYIDSEEMGVRM